MYDVVQSGMVPQTLEFLTEQQQHIGKIKSPIILGFISGMRYRSPDQPGLFYWKGFANAAELFAFPIAELSDAVRELEVHTDINLTFNRVSYLAHIGLGPRLPLLIIERSPFVRGIAFEVEERGMVRQSFIDGDFSFSEKAKAAQQHYSTAISLLAGEDQIAGLLDASFMQFYLSIECVLEAHDKSKAVRNGVSFFGPRFDTSLKEIVDHVYVARHRFFGHGHPKSQDAFSNPATAFAIAKQTLVARWCARSLIGLELKRQLVRREMRLFPDVRTSISFDGDAKSLRGEFALPA